VSWGKGQHARQGRFATVFHVTRYNMSQMPSTDLVRALDVSGFQPPIDWGLVRDEGFKAVWARAAHGNDKDRPGVGIGKDGTDVMFRKHAQGARQAGLHVGMYAVAYPLPHLNPITQADWFFERSDTLGTQDGELAPALDFEWPPSHSPGQKPFAEWKRWGCTGGQMLAWALMCCIHMEHLWKRPPVLYTYPWFWKTVTSATDVDPAHLQEIGRFTPWLAGGPYYEKATTVWVPTSKDVKRWFPKLSPWDQKDGPWVWQHDGTGGLSVGKADVDMNVMTADTLKLLTSKPPAM
jgi:GH25 family lysozyme M1 (1,4-beta-N-acetylmuramidase)